MIRTAMPGAFGIAGLGLLWCGAMWSVWLVRCGDCQMWDEYPVRCGGCGKYEFCVVRCGA